MNAPAARSEAPEPSPSSLERLAADVESEILLLLLMSPESLDELEEMFTHEDQQKLRMLGGTVRAGIDGVMRNLVVRELVVEIGSLDSGNVDTSDQVWQLTRFGERAARRFIANGQ